MVRGKTKASSASRVSAIVKDPYLRVFIGAFPVNQQQPSKKYRVISAMNDKKTLYKVVSLEDENRIFKMQIVMLDMNKDHIEAQLTDQVNASMETADSPYVETLHEILQVGQRIMLIFRHGEETESLRNIMKANSAMNLNDDACEYALFCVSKAIQAMHKCNFVVQNLQIRNVVRKGDDTLQLSNLTRCFDVDNGPASRCPKEEKTSVPPPEEIVEGKPGGKPSDIFALGVIAH